MNGQSRLARDLKSLENTCYTVYSLHVRDDAQHAPSKFPCGRIPSPNGRGRTSPRLEKSRWRMDALRDYTDSDSSGDDSNPVSVHKYNLHSLNIQTFHMFFVG